MSCDNSVPYFKIVNIFYFPPPVPNPFLSKPKLLMNDLIMSTRKKMKYEKQKNRNGKKLLKNRLI